MPLLDTPEDSISELGDISIESLKTGKQGEQKLKKTEETIQGLGIPTKDIIYV